MHDKKNNKKNFIEFLKFTLFMVGAAIVQIVTFAIMNDFLPEAYRFPLWLSNILSIIFSVIFSFTLNRKFTFKEANNVYVAMLLVGAYYLVFTPLSGWFASAVDGKIPDYVVEVISMVVNFITEFLFNKFIVYKKKKKIESLEPSPELEDTPKSDESLS